MPKVEFVCPEHGVMHSYDTNIFSPDVPEMVREHEASLYCKRCGRRLTRNEYNNESHSWTCSKPYHYYSTAPPHKVDYK